jgi:predicted extracellular nuclease
LKNIYSINGPNYIPLKMNYLLWLVLSLLSITFSYCQATRSIVCYNVENLFDTIDDPNKDDQEFLPSASNEWNTAKYVEKLNHINKVLDEMTDPLIIGLVEIENASVVRDLIKNSPKMNHKYGVVHFDSPDARGIDVAMIYDSSALKLMESNFIRYTLPDTSYSATRDIIWAKYKKGKDIFYAMVNHWPSRRSGEKESEVNRIIAATAARKFIDSLLQPDPRVKIVFMGDLNDHPDDIAPQMIYEKLSQMIYPESGEFGGSYCYKNNWEVLDHLSVSPYFFSKKGIQVVPYSGKIHSFDFLISEYKGNKVPFRTYASKKYLAGYSDHLPVSIQVRCKK